MRTPRFGDHPRGQVDAGHLQVQLMQPSGDVSGAASEVGYRPVAGVVDSSVNAASSAQSSGCVASASRKRSE